MTPEEEIAVRRQGVWCCSKQRKCTWQGYALYQGLAWGSIESVTPEWRKWHDRMCKGELIQLIEKEKAHDTEAGEFKEVCKD